MSAKKEDRYNAFRTQRSNDLKIVAACLDRLIGDVNSSSIYNAASQLEKEIPRLKGGESKLSYWGYEIDGFEMPVSTLRHVRPQGIRNASLTLNMKLIADIDCWDTYSDPFLEFNFNAVLKGVGDKNSYMGFHIDRHENSDNDSDEPHPLYHLQYNPNPNRKENFEHGDVMCLDTPRIMHFPLDFILGIGFLTTNFFPVAFESLSDEPLFRSLYKNYQEKIIKPYSHAIANNWVFEKEKLNWQPNIGASICPYLL